MMTIRLLFLMFIAVLFTGCAKPMIEVADRDKPIAHQVENRMLLESNDRALSYISRYGYVYMYTNDQCNFFYDQKCGMKDARNPRTSRLFSYHRESHLKALRKEVEKEVPYLEKHLGLSLIDRSKPRQYMVRIKGLSNNKVTTVYPEWRKYWKNSQRHTLAVLDLRTALHKKVPYDPSGYLISGYKTVEISDSSFKENAQGKSWNILIPIRWHERTENKESDKHEALAFIYDTKLNPETGEYKQRYILAKGIPELFGWLKDSSDSPYQKIVDKQLGVKKIKDIQLKAAADKFKAKKAFFNKRLRKLGLTLDFEKYSEVSEVYESLSSSLSRIKRLNCSSFNLAKNECKSIQRKYVRWYKADINRISPNNATYQNYFNDIFGKNNQKAMNSVLSDYKLNNNVTWDSIERNFPYVENSKGLRKQIQKIEDGQWSDKLRSIREQSAAASQKSWQKTVAGLSQPLETDKFFKQQNQNMRDFVANAKRLEAESNRPYSSPSKTTLKSKKYQRELADVDNSSSQSNKGSSSAQSSSSKRSFEDAVWEADSGDWYTSQKVANSMAETRANNGAAAQCTKQGGRSGSTKRMYKKGCDSKEGFGGRTEWKCTMKAVRECR